MVRQLGDERESRMTDLATLQDVIHTYRSLSIVLHDQLLTQAADHMMYLSKVKGRRILVWQGAFFSYMGSWFLDLISGYGYRPLRSLITYLLVIGAFAVTYYILGNNVHPPLDPLGAVVFSITSFHGRGFTPGEQVALTNPLTVLAAVEAIFGLLIEITFIATFTQRFFAR